MSVNQGVRRYEYRPCRIDAGFIVDFRSSEETYCGLCTNVSDTGIRVVLNGSVLIGSSGILALRHPVGALQLQAKVAYIENGQVGLVFLFQTEMERDVTALFITSIANQSADLLVIRIP